MKEPFSKYQILLVHEEITSILKDDYFDIRVELVDHILNDIDNRVQSKSELQPSFNDALQAAIRASGGKKGIRDIAFNRKYELWKKYLLDHSNAFRIAISWPHVLISTIVFLLIFNLLHNVENYIWIFLLCSIMTGIIELVDRWGSRGWINENGATLSIFPIYSRSAFVTNLPLLLMLPAQFPELFLINSLWTCQFLAALGLFTFLVFFIFRFYQLKKGVRQEIKKYRLIHQQLITLV